MQGSPRPPPVRRISQETGKSQWKARREHFWRLHVRQEGARVVAVIQRIDGDTGNLYGQWQDGKFTVSHFTAAGPSYAELMPLSDGSLRVITFAHKGELQQLSSVRTQTRSVEKQEAAD